jgi:hypothetical protein
MHLSPQGLSDVLALVAGISAPSVETIRDWVIIVSGSLMTLVLFLLVIVVVVLGLSARALLKTVQSTLTDDLKPLLDSVRQSVSTVQGTTAFIGENAVAPVVRAYGIVAGVRRALGVLSGVIGRKDRPE